MYIGHVQTSSGEHLARLVSVVTGQHDTLPVNTIRANEVDSLQTYDWAVEGLSSGLVKHAIRDAKRSGASFILGETPELWSPLASVDVADMGKFLSNADLLYSIAHEGLSVEHLGELTTAWSVEGKRFAIMGIALDAFAVAVPTTALSVSIAVDMDPFMLDASAMEVHLPLSDNEASETGFDELIVWRIYSGGNSLIVDTVTRAVRGVHRLAVGFVRDSWFAVGRAIWVRSKKLNSERDDPTAKPRLAYFESRASKPLVPRLEDVTVDGDAIIVVHGTMATSVALARAIAKLAPDVPVLRFEHDTWHSLQSNVEALCELLDKTVSGRVVIVAHSRGGLVATRAKHYLKQRSGPPMVLIVTLGTPFDGTPVAVGADVVYLAMKGVLGGIRFAGGPVVDAFTRLASFVLTLEAARGLQVMYPGNDALRIIRDTLNDTVFAFAGRASYSQTDRYGIASMAAGVFGEEDSDLIVSTVSAQHTTGMVVECDHFGYLENADVIEKLRALLANLNLSGQLHATDKKVHPGEQDLDQKLVRW